MIDANVILDAYRNGSFPMGDYETGTKIWFDTPHTRGAIDINHFHIPRSLLAKIKAKSCGFSYRINSNFKYVIRECANREKTWISKEIIESYENLNLLGHCFSFETYLDNKIVGGLFATILGGAFFCESLFHTVSDASKAALVFSIAVAKKNGFVLYDVQYYNNKFLQDRFKLVSVTYQEHLARLNDALKHKCTIVPDIDEKTDIRLFLKSNKFA